MEPSQTSFDLLAHFDRPKTIDASDLEWVAGVERSEPPAEVGDAFAPPQPLREAPVERPRITKRGIGWVLAWAGALAVLGFAASVLTEFTYLLAAEHKLALAARAGVAEATLPRATYRSVTESIEHRLTDYPLLARQLRLTLAQNGSPVQRQFRQNEGDRFTVTLAAPNSAVVPDWLRIIMFWRGDSRIQAEAERQMPGRELRPARIRAS